MTVRRSPRIHGNTSAMTFSNDKMSEAEIKTLEDVETGRARHLVSSEVCTVLSTGDWSKKRLVGLR